MKLRIAVIAGLTVLVASLQAPSCYADMLPSSPDPSAPETKWILLAGLAFVAVVSGVSFFLLRGVAHRRADSAAMPNSPTASGAEESVQPPSPGAGVSDD